MLEKAKSGITTGALEGFNGNVNKYAQKRVDLNRPINAVFIQQLTIGTKIIVYPPIRSGDINFAKNMVLFK